MMSIIYHINLLNKIVIDSACGVTNLALEITVLIYYRVDNRNNN